MTTDAAEELLDALVPLLVRGFRVDVYVHLQAGCPVELTDGTYPLLEALGHGPATSAQVARRVGVDRTVATKQATALQQAGLIGRRPDPEDARGTLLELTDAGRATASFLRRSALDLVAGLGDRGLGDADLRRAAHVLVALRAAVADSPG